MRGGELRNPDGSSFLRPRQLSVAKEEKYIFQLTLILENMFIYIEEFQVTE